MYAPIGIDAAGEAFGERHDVGDDAGAIASEHRATAAEPRLHFVGNQERAGAIA